MYERDLKQEVQDPLQKSLFPLKKEKTHICGIHCTSLCTVFCTNRSIGIDHEHKGIKEISVPAALLSSVHLVES